MTKLKNPNRIRVGEKEKKIMRVKLQAEGRIHEEKRNRRYNDFWDVK